jgi:hypothetical protein
MHFALSLRQISQASFHNGMRADWPCGNLPAHLSMSTLKCLHFNVEDRQPKSVVLRCRRFPYFSEAG